MAKTAPFNSLKVGQFSLTKTSLTPVKAPSEAEWTAFGLWVETVHKGNQWWVGDWLSIGEGLLGEKYAQAIDATRWDVDTLMQYQRIAGAVPVRNRRDDLSWSHHREVAHLPADQQREWLARAVAEGWSCERLRREMKQAAGGNTNTMLYVLVACVDAADQQQFLERMQTENRQVKAVEKKTPVAA